MDEERKQLENIFINVCLRKDKKKHFVLILLSPESTEPFTRSNSKLVYFQVLLFVGKCLVLRYLSKIFEIKSPRSDFTSSDKNKISHVISISSSK